MRVARAVHVHVYICMCTCMCIHACVHACVYMYASRPWLLDYVHNPIADEEGSPCVYDQIFSAELAVRAERV